MRLKLTILLALLNAALFTTIVVLEREKTGSHDPEDSRLVLSPGLVDQTDKIEIEGGAITGSWIMQKSNNQWFLTNPVRWTANSFAIRRILSTLKNLNSATKFPIDSLEKAGRSMSDYGLDNPKAIIRLHHEGQVTSIKIGESVEIGSRLYILSPDESHVCVIERDILSNISLDLGTLSDQSIFNIPLFETQSINMQYGNLKVRVARQGATSWMIETPIQARADKAKVETTLNGLLQSRIQSFEETSLANQGLVNPQIRIRIEGNNRQTLLVGNKFTNRLGVPVYYAQLTEHPTVFTMEAAPLDALQTAQEDLRDAKFVRFNPKLLSALEIAQQDIKISLKRLETGNWRIIQHDTVDGLQSMPADPDILVDIVTGMLNLEAEKFYSDAPSAADLTAFGFSDPQRTVTLQAGTQQVLILGNYDPKNGLVYARMQDKPFVYQISSDLLFALKLNPLNYRNRILQELPPAAKITHFKLINLQDVGDSSVLDYAINPASGDWAQVWTDASDDEKDALRSLIGYLRKFKVKEFIRNEFSEEGFELDSTTRFPWKFRLDTTLKLPAGDVDKESTFSLYFTERVGGSTQFGGSPDYSVAYKNTEELIEALFVFTRSIRKPDTIPLPDVPADLETIQKSEPADQPGQ